MFNFLKKNDARSKCESLKRRAIKSAGKCQINNELIPYLSQAEIKESNKIVNIHYPFVEWVSIICSVLIVVYSLALNYQLTIIIGIPLSASIGFILSDIIKLVFLYEIDLLKFNVVPMYQKIVISVCMIISVFAFFKVISINNNVFDLRSEQYIQDKQLYDTRLKALKQASDVELQNFVSVTEVSRAYNLYLSSSNTISSFLNKALWMNGVSQSRSILLSTNNIICKKMYNWITRRDCPKYQKLKFNQSNYLNRYNLLKSSRNNGAASKIYTSFLMTRPEFQTTSFESLISSSRVNIYTIILLGILIEVCGFLFITRRMTAYNAIVGYRNDTMIARNFLLKLIEKHIVFSDVNKSGSEVNFNLASALQCVLEDAGMFDEINLSDMKSLYTNNVKLMGFASFASFKEALIKHNLISLKSGSKSIFVVTKGKM
jgi:hypothetical protein